MPLNTKATFEHRDLNGLGVVFCDWFKVTTRGKEGCACCTSGCLCKESSAVHACILQASDDVVNNPIFDGTKVGEIKTAPNSPQMQTGREGAAGLIVSGRLVVLGEVRAVCQAMRNDGFDFGALGTG